MSVHVSCWVWTHSNAPYSGLPTLLALACLADDDGYVLTRPLTLAEFCRCHVNTIERHVDESVARLELAVIPCPDVDGSAQNLCRFVRYAKMAGRIDNPFDQKRSTTTIYDRNHAMPV